MDSRSYEDPRPLISLTPDVLERAITDLLPVFEQVAGTDADKTYGSWLVGWGWTPEFLQFLGSLGVHAVAVGVAPDVARCNEVTGDMRTAQERATGQVIDGAEEACRYGWLGPDLKPWLMLLASQSDTTEHEALRARLERGPSWGVEWRGILPEIAALAYAAGLSPTETRTQVADGAPDEKGLRLLAGLRGYRLP